MRTRIGQGLAVAAGLALSATAMADFTFSVFNPASYNPGGQGWVGTTWNNLDLVAHNGGSIPADTYIGYNVVFDWTKLPGVGGGTYQWNSEASMAFTSAPVTGTSSALTGGGTLHTATRQNVSNAANPGSGGSFPYTPAVDSATSATNLQFFGTFATNYTGGTNPFYFNFQQRFDSSSTGRNASWSNVRITLRTTMVTPDPLPPPPPPPAFSGNFTGTPNTLALFGTAVGTTIWNHLAPQAGLTDGAGESLAMTQYAGSGFDHLGNEVAYRIDHLGGDIQLDLTGLSTDLDLILLDSSGTPADTLAGSYGTGSEQIAGSLPAGTYYVIVDTFGGSNAGSTFSLSYIPAPSSVALLGLGGLAAARRRRA